MADRPKSRAPVIGASLFMVVIVPLIVVLIISRNGGGAGLAADPLIAGEDFGGGVIIGTRVTQARDAKAAKGIELKLMTREELAQHDPYDERQEGNDLLVCLYSEELGGSEAVIAELRCYLAAPAESVATLRGGPAAPMSPAQVEQAFGKPYDSSTSSDARTHLTYYFADRSDKTMAYKLTTSHEYDGRCFALALAKVPAPR